MHKSSCFGRCAARDTGEYVALEAVETALLGGAGDFIAHGCCWVYANSTQRRPVAVVVPSKDA